MKNKILLFLLLVTFALFSFDCKNTDYSNSKERIVKIETSYGDILVKLYNETPLHRDNFIKLVESGFYDGVLFHRIIKDFMIQTGDPNSKNSTKDQMLGIGGPGYTIPAEFNTNFIHKKGALAAARQGDKVNPKQESSGSQFYIVVGKPCTDKQLEVTEKNINNALKNKLFNKIISEKLGKLGDNITQEQQKAIYEEAIEETKKEYEKNGVFSYTDEQKEIYKTIGGTPHLDAAYTVFGEVIEGLDIVEKISLVPTNNRTNRPIDDIKIKMSIVK